MKYRIQLNASFSNSDCNSILNQIESFKSLVYKPDYYTPITIERVSTKSSIVDDLETPTVYSSVDFDGEAANHTDVPEGVTNCRINVDISFSNQSDLSSFINYIEYIKDNAISNSYNTCRYFECNHDELTNPLPKDGAYTYINFDVE